MKLYSARYLANQMSEPVEFIEELLYNPGNFMLGDTTWVFHDDGSDELQMDEVGLSEIRDIVLDIRTWPGGVSAFMDEANAEMDRVKSEIAKRSDAS